MKAWKIKFVNLNWLDTAQLALLQKYVFFTGNDIAEDIFDQADFVVGFADHIIDVGVNDVIDDCVDVYDDFDVK